MVYHKDLVDDELHPAAYVQSTAPTTNLLPGVLWIDTSSGVGNYIIKIRNSDNDGWEIAGSSKYAFMATVDSGGQSLTTGTLTQIQFATEQFDPDSVYASNQFVAPVAGLYEFEAQISIGSWVANSEIDIRVRVNGSTKVQHTRNDATTGRCVAAIKTRLSLAAGDIVTVYGSQSTGTTKTISTTTTQSWFSGSMV